MLVQALDLCVFEVLLLVHMKEGKVLALDEVGVRSWHFSSLASEFREIAQPQTTSQIKLTKTSNILAF